MAELGRTVRVSGLPTDIEDNILRDKLLIYFLRRKNGGGEIESVTIIKATPVCALITFEDSGVAQGVIQHGRHILEVNEKRHEVIVTEHQESLDPEKVILSLSATVDCSQLPGGMSALKSLQKSHPDIQINRRTTEELCTLHGAYSKVQAALAQLLGHPGGLKSAEKKDSDQPANSGPSFVHIPHKPDTHESDQNSKPRKQRYLREKDHNGRLTDEYRSSSSRPLTSAGYGWEDTSQSEGAASQNPERHTTPEEDFSLIVDADMFQYLKRHCRNEYQKILSQYGVDLVDVTNQGLTTLFLHVSTGDVEDGPAQEQMKLAKISISRLYQENEYKIRRAQIPKTCLSLKGGLQRAMENLSVRLPKLLLNEDEQNVYVIGSSSDVSEAKQFLILDHGEEKEDLASVPKYPLYDSGTPSHADVQRFTLTSSSRVDPAEDRLDQLLRSEEDERRDEGSKRYKLAARFKDSGLAALGNRPTDFSLRGLSSPRKQANNGPMLGHDVLSEAADTLGGGVLRATAQNTGEDILFRSLDPLTPLVSVKNKTSLNSHLADTRPKSLTSPHGTTQSTLSGSSLGPPAGSGSSLKRASSFSGTPQQKAQIIGRKSQEDPGKTRTRSSSFSNQTGGHKQEVYIAEITVSSMMWQHIKAAYGTRVDDLTSDVQMKESSSKGGTDLTLTLRGATWSIVSSCQQGLQKLVDSVSVDFNLLELKLSELGTNSADETLQACCAEVQRQYKKVTVQVFSTSLFVFGPKKLCSLVVAALREVFSPNPERHGCSSLPAFNRDSSILVQTNEHHDARLQTFSNPQTIHENHASQTDGTGFSLERGTNHRSEPQETEGVNGSTSQPLVKKNPVIKEKVKVVGMAEKSGQKALTEMNSRESHDDGAESRMTASTDKDVVNLQREKTPNSSLKDNIQQSQKDTLEESAAGGLGCICVCGESDESMTKTKCGATFCSKCLKTVHTQCKVCCETEPTPQGIRGKMKFSKINIKIPGHKKDSAIKVTYTIPDGIQGSGHPSPGKAFSGGRFESFFPDCEETRRLLPRLEKAFKKGLTFSVVETEQGAKVTWDCIPHKTTTLGGKSGCGYPDSTYLSRLSEVLTNQGIEDPTVKSSE
ncbi:uncharacterized protein si:busm1-163l24.3 [Xyrichtys novacula]|uniref:RING-type E3 ubiquitin transferase n=1 Tax=Xyrichtys novacula TaxID=13765 RepID=A0AAV1GSS1_XYRNO|nr:uncharacterized protein si:busm1-163l24.3 [Xyrichtys novacula]